MYKQKYNKYKSKYLNLLNQIGGDIKLVLYVCNSEDDMDTDMQNILENFKQNGHTFEIYQIDLDKFDMVDNIDNYDIIFIQM